MPGYRLPGPLCGTSSETIDAGTLCQNRSPLPGPIGIHTNSARLGSQGDPKKSAGQFLISNNGIALLKQIEHLYLTPYDDQTGKEIKAWTTGATIGYGHLIKAGEWATYKNGISASGAGILFERDLAPFAASVCAVITEKLRQNEFDALVIFAFNIGVTGFSGSSVVRLVNDPSAASGYPNLEAAWKAWNKSQGNIMKGLENRRDCEWKIYSRGIYEGW